MTTYPAITMKHWSRQLSTARRAARAAALAIRPDFGARDITAYKGPSDVQLRADLIAQKAIISVLSGDFPDYGIVSEEGLDDYWPDTRFTWVIDPLDGTNNFGYGIAHCAIALSLFSDSQVVLSLIYDPILQREFSATGSIVPIDRELRKTDLSRATLSLVTGYSQSARDFGERLEGVLTRRCKRVLNLWAPALDLALVSTGAIDGLVCLEAKLLDVCAGLHLLDKSDACVLDLKGQPLTPSRELWAAPVSFVAATNPDLAADLLAAVDNGGQGSP